MKGRKPKPTKLKELAGFPGHGARPKAEPKPAGDLGDPPAWLTEGQREGWVYALANAPRGMLKRIDRGALVVWVVAEDLHRQASTQQAATGNLLVKPPKSDFPVQSPYLPIINKQAQIMLKAAEHLGFTPAARPRIGAPLNPLPPINDSAVQQTAGEMPAEDDDLDGYLAGNPARLN